MPKKFCYKCGALEEENTPLIDGLCQDCFLEENTLVKAPEEVSLKICNQCGAFFINQVWHDIEKNPASEYLEAAKELVTSEVEVLQKGPTGFRYVDFRDSEGVDISYNTDYTSSEDILVEVIVRAKFFDTENNPIEKRTVKVKLDKQICEICNKRKSGYYEAILQVRGEEELSENKLTEIYNELNETYNKIHNHNRSEFVSKVKEKHGGIDLYTSSSQLAENLAKTLKKEYEATIDKSAELVGQTEDGKEQYRVTVIARLPF